MNKLLWFFDEVLDNFGVVAVIALLALFVWWSTEDDKRIAAKIQACSKRDGVLVHAGRDGGWECVAKR